MNKSLSFKYFKYEYSKNLKMLLYMGVVGFVCYIIPLFSMEPNIHTKTTNVGLIITLFALACYIIPIFMNAYRYNKKLANRNYSCPISRFALFNVNYLVGLINIITFYTVFYFLGMLIVAIKLPAYGIIYYMPLYFVILLIGICVYTLNYFVASRANTVIDAVIFIIMYTFVFSMIVGLVEKLFSISHSINEKFITFSGFVNWGNAYNDCIALNHPLKIFDKNTFYAMIVIHVITKSDIIITFVVLPIVAITSYVLLMIMAKKESAENASEISNSYFGYRVLNPVYMISAIALCTYAFEGKILIVLILIGIFTIIYLALNFIYYRKFKLPMKEWIIYAATIVLGVIFSLIIAYNESKKYELFGDNTPETVTNIILPLLGLR